MTMKFFSAILLLVSCALCVLTDAFKTTPYPQLNCYQCDDAVYGCRTEALTTESCQIGTTACMVEMFFAPNGSRKFSFRAGCAARYSCPTNHTKLMCTDFINNVKTCRLCCFENKCHDPTPGSEMRVKVMKDSLLDSGFKPDELDELLARENEIALNRGRKASYNSALSDHGVKGESSFEAEEMASELEGLIEETERETGYESRTHAEQTSTDYLRQQVTEMFGSDQNINADATLIIESETITTYATDEASEKPIEEDDEFLKSPTSNINTVAQNGREFTPERYAPNKPVANGRERMGIESKGEHMSDQALGDEQTEDVPAAVSLKTLGNSASKGVVAISSMILYIPFLPFVFV
ncbi:hypothetical protein Aperf_G00000049831 [Anoplocephala perfoliata]